MKRLVISATLLVSFISCLAQWSTRATVEISTGASFPFGEFAYTNSFDSNSGYAKAGYALAVSFNYRVNDHLGLVALVSRYRLGVDESSIVKQYQSWQTGWDWEVEATRWKLNAFMGGIDLIVPIYRSDFNFRLLGGMAHTRLPGLTGIGASFEREATSDIAAAWGAGAGLTYEYFDKITLSLRLDFFMTHPVLEQNLSYYPASDFPDISQNIIIVNLTAGLGFRIFKQGH